MSKTNTKTIRKAALALVENDKLLLVRTVDQTIFQIPGGKIEAAETAIEALVRESREELGITVAAGTIKKLGVFTAPAAGRKNVTVEVTLFTANYHGKPSANSEIAELYWHPLNSEATVASAVVQERIVPFLRKYLAANN